MSYITAIALALFALFWIYEFIQLMLLADEDFPGRYDKALWVAVFAVAFVVAPLAFYGWRIAHRAMQEELDRRKQRG
jgi:hypothetical protein